jgi:hypothetical protein
VLVRRHPDASVAAGLVLLPFVLMSRALLPGRVLSPADIVLTFPPWNAIVPGLRSVNGILVDVALLFQPALVYAGRELRAGRFPLWNPHEFTGAPFFANPQTAILFPPNWLAFVLPLPLGLTLAAILKVSIAGLSMYWFLRELRLRPLPSLVGALAYQLDGMLVVWLGWSTSSAMAVAPLLFATAERLRGRGDRRSVAALAAAVALVLLAGYPQISIQALLATAVWVLYRAPGVGLRYVAASAAGGVLGAMLAAVQLVPFAEYLGQSSVYYYRALWLPDLSPPIGTALALLMPYYFGHPGGAGGSAFWGYWNLNEITASVGLVPWLALPVTLGVAWHRTGTKVLAGLAAFGGVMLYGVPPLSAALAALPVLSLVISHRAAALLAFGLAALCAVGLDAARDVAPERQRRARLAVKGAFVALVAIAFVALAHDWPTHARLGAGRSAPAQYIVFLILLTAAAVLMVLLIEGRGPRPLLAALAVIEVASLGQLVLSYNPVIDARLLYPAPPPAVRFLQAATARDGGRVALPLPNLAKLYGLSEVASYDGMTPRRIEQVVSPALDLGLLASGGLSITVPYASAAFDLLGIRHLAVPPQSGPQAPHFELEYQGSDARVYRNPRALPRAFVVGTARCMSDDTLLRFMRDNAIDFSREVVLAGCETPPVAGAVGAGHATIATSEPAEVIVDVTADGPAYLVLTDTAFPGWHVTVNGAERPLWCADYAFRAVELPRGASRVAFRYRPASLRVGLSASAVAVIVVVLLACRRPVGSAV